MNISKNKSNISKIRSNNIIIEDSKNIANIFNENFSTIGANLAKNIPPSNKYFSEFLDQPNPNSICFTPTTRYEIIDIVSALKNKKSAGHDEIDNFILKGVLSSIADPLEYIFYVSLSTGQVPEQMKIAKVIPLFFKRR